MEDKKEIFEIVSTPFFFSVKLNFFEGQLKSVNFIDKEPDFRTVHSLSNIWDDMKSYFSGKKVAFNVPFRIDYFTEFEKRVLKTVEKIEYGKITTYKNIALYLGDKRLARAVGNALRKNPLPIIIPCHRVIGSDGSLGGFMGKNGIEIKGILLKIEKAY